MTADPGDESAGRIIAMPGSLQAALRGATTVSTDSELRAYRLLDAVANMDVAKPVLRDALRAMTAARFLIAVVPSPSLLERSEIAVDVLGRAITRLQYALNDSEVEPDGD